MRGAPSSSATCRTCVGDQSLHHAVDDHLARFLVNKLVTCTKQHMMMFKARMLSPGYDTPGKTPRGHSAPPAWPKAVPGRPRQNRTSCSTLGHIPGAGPGKRQPGTGEAPPTFKALSHPGCHMHVQTYITGWAASWSFAHDKHMHASGHLFRIARSSICQQSAVHIASWYGQAFKMQYVAIHAHAAADSHP